MSPIHSIKPKKQIALLGNPNVGKSTLFNALTGAHQYVGNWPGVTVEKLSGFTPSGWEVIDLPGVYSLCPCSPEEAVTRRFLLEEPPGCIVQVVDAACLERNLYLTLQLMALKRPMVLAVNRMDALAGQGRRLDCSRLGRELGIPSIPISARHGENLQALLQAVEQAKPAPPPPWEERTASALRRIEGLLDGQRFPEFLAERLLEGEEGLAEELGVGRQATELARRYGPDGEREARMAEERYQWIEGIARRCLTGRKRERRFDPDRILLGRWTAYPCLWGALAGVCWLTFGTPGQALSRWAQELLLLLAAPLERLEWGWLGGLLREGLVGGLAGVLAFLPQITLLFLCLTLLEDSGYMARAALLLDRPLRGLGLPGKAFIPLIMGLGCSVPAVMAARTLERDEDRRAIMLAAPLMPCSARLPACALVAGACFPGHTGGILLGLCLLGSCVSAAVGAILRRTLLKGKEAPFVMEVPALCLPGMGGVFRHLWEKCRGFLTKAGTVIVAMNGVVWFCRSLTPGLRPAADLSESILGWISGRLLPFFEPLGFGNTAAAGALLSGLAAKESVAGSLSILSGGDPARLFTPAAAAAFLLFVLLYTPCVSTLGALRRELGFGWAAASAALSTGIAWGAAWAAYRIGSVFLAGGAAPASGGILPVPWEGQGLLLGALAAGLLLARGLLRTGKGCCRGCAGCPGQGRCPKGRT